MKTYSGKRHITGATEVWVLDGQGGRILDPAPSLKLRNHSPTGFEWGYQGSGPAQLALAILLDYTGDADLAQRHYQLFKCEVLAGQGNTFVLTSQTIDRWLGHHGALVARPAMTAAQHNAFPKGRW